MPLIITYHTMGPMQSVSCYTVIEYIPHCTDTLHTIVILHELLKLFFVVISLFLSAHVTFSVYHCV